MAVQWLEFDYSDLARPAANAAPASWGAGSLQESLEQADEAYATEVDGRDIAAARLGRSTLRAGSELVRQDLPTEAQAHAEYARLRAELSGLITHRLQAAGAALAAARVGERTAMSALAAVARAAVAEGMDKVSVAQHAGIARVTLYAMLRNKS